jgi:hypothetical protein
MVACVHVHQLLPACDCRGMQSQHNRIMLRPLLGTRSVELVPVCMRSQTQVAPAQSWHGYSCCCCRTS